ncbi:hypothetical protein OV320_8175 [Actinobacteria bacterium OV320]|nr:hypothetical protein OV320_8175 [Actinobacteria bacterium OV320]
MAWSGMTSYDLGKPRQRMGLYRTVLHEGLRDDLPRYLNRDLLLQLCEREDLQSNLTGAEWRRSIVSLFQQERVAEIAP